MVSHINPSISVDCVIFGFDGKDLKVLLIDFQRVVNNEGAPSLKFDLKLPGSLILDNEEIDTAANRTLTELTSLSQVYLRQFSVFSNPDRINKKEDYEWIEKTYGVKVSRIVTVAYYALVKIDKSILQPSVEGEARWHSVQNIRSLAFDHKLILIKALEVLTQQLLNEPIAFELLQKRFSIRQLQNLYEAILGIEIDNRNFRKKVLKFSFLKLLEEKEKEVAHKPARLYKFDKLTYEKEIKRHKLQLNFFRFFSA
jgi:8-oxo-dGTP diphosphatase